MILSVLRHAGQHLSANEILDVVKQTYPFVDVSTVYRTLSVFKRMRLVAETDLGTGDYSYEWLESRRHHHLICRSCDTVVAVEHSPVEALGQALLAEHGFHSDLDHFAIFGLCRNCYAEPAAAGQPPADEVGH
jgi:Fur family ferric uptake transcriptional regulator